MELDLREEVLVLQIKAKIPKIGYYRGENSKNS